jgi:hypothetical protein
MSWGSARNPDADATTATPRGDCCVSLTSSPNRSDNSRVSSERNVCAVCELAVAEDDSYIVIGRSGEEPERVHEGCMAVIRRSV